MVMATVITFDHQTQPNQTKGGITKGVSTTNKIICI